MLAVLRMGWLIAVLRMGWLMLVSLSALAVYWYAVTGRIGHFLAALGVLALAVVLRRTLTEERG